MKSFAVLAVVAGVASAQSLGSCAQMCADNMAKIAQTEFMCGAGDVACFCSKSNWANGLRDCSAQACDATQAAQAVAWGTQQCAGVATGAPSASAAVSVLSSVAGSASGVLASASAVVSSAVASGAQSVPVTTMPLLATITNSAGSVVTQTTGFSTIYSHLTGGAASAASSVASAQASAASSASGAVASALSSASAALSSGASAAASSAHASGSAGSTGAPSSGAAVPMMTAMPLAAAAGAAAMFFL